MPILRHWRIFELSGLTAAAEEARRRLVEHLDALEVSARKFEARMASSDKLRIARAG
jgi:acyl-[acyl-carrier-protein] desaturase